MQNSFPAQVAPLFGVRTYCLCTRGCKQGTDWQLPSGAVALSHHAYLPKRKSSGGTEYIMFSGSQFVRFLLTMLCLCTVCLASNIVLNRDRESNLMHTDNVHCASTGNHKIK